MKLTLVRSFSDDFGTTGILVLHDNIKLLSGEQPWLENKKGVSCIPPGVYPCVWAPSPHFGRDVYHVTNVKDRDAILIHPANFMGNREKGLKSDLEGCIALGMTIGERDGQKALLDSRKAVAVFEAFLDKKPFDLEIVYL